jgi:myo-inositol-1(or 4)-monophosphatase
MIVRASDDLERVTVKNKSANDFVSEVDEAAEREIVHQLHRAYPEHAVLGEESGRSGPDDAEYLWVIDPLDGTTNFHARHTPLRRIYRLFAQGSH